MNEALGEYILFLNDDAILGRHFFKDLLVGFGQDVAIVGCEASKMTWGVNGAIMCIRRELFEQAGGFDEHYFFMREDGDLCENMKRRGYNIVISKASASHPTEGSNSTWREGVLFQDNWHKNWEYFNKKWQNYNRIIGVMIVGNEAGRMLKEAVENLFKRDLIDELVIVADGSTDSTPRICKKLAEQYPIKFYYHNFKMFGTRQYDLRKRALDYAISLNPYGILCPDADEIFDEDFNRAVIYRLLNSKPAWTFKIVHFWKDKKHIRVDGKWAHENNVRLYRYEQGKSQAFIKKNVHCGSAPEYAYHSRSLSEYVFYHYGHASKKFIKEKIERYKKYDPYGQFETSRRYNDLTTDGKVVRFNKEKFLNKYSI